MSRNSIKKLKTGGRVLLVLYLACLIYFMFFSESYGRTEVHVESITIYGKQSKNC